MFVYKCFYIYKYIGIQYAYWYTYMYTFIHVHMCVYIYIYIYQYIYIYARCHDRVDVCVYARAHAFGCVRMLTFEYVRMPAFTAEYNLIPRFSLFQ